MHNAIGWLIVFIGALIGVIPTMMLQVWNGASLLGLIIASGGSWMVVKGAHDV